MSQTYYYNPTPPRVWSRVQNPCTFTLDSSYNSIYIPLTNEFVSQADANFKKKQLYKGNILQYKNNSSNLTKKQKYSQISKGLWSNRTKVFATQSQTYTNPNSTGLKWINSTEIPFPNQIVGSPNNISGPYQYGINNPFNCPTTSIKEGGSLVCNAYENPCTGVVTKTLENEFCFPTYCSDVPGSIIDLCWNPKIQTIFPRQRYNMSNSGTKWPEGYKGLISAAKPVAPILSIDSYNSTSLTLSWTSINNICLPISSYNIYQNNILIQNVSYTTTKLTLNTEINTTYVFFVTAISTAIESAHSNSITYNS